MDSKRYLKSYGWVEGEALKKGGLKRPILVKHKRDTKGLGHDSKEGEMWWEKMFDGQLKNLDVMNAGGITFQQTEKVQVIDKSPLYKMFVKGEGLAGTVDIKQEQQVIDMKNNKKKKKKTKDKVEKKKKKKKIN